MEIREEEGVPVGLVDFGGARREVCLAFVADEAHVDDYVVVHVGFALSLVAEEDARRTMELLTRLGALEELEERPLGSGETVPDAGTSGRGGRRE